MPWRDIELPVNEPGMVQWRPVARWMLPDLWRTWVLDSGSLTKRLIQASHGQFAVRPLREAWLYPRVDEARALQMPLRQKAWIREVELLCFGDVWVRARSVVPRQTLTGVERQLQHLGSRPLGAFLFAAPTMVREPMQVARVDSGRHATFGRRSVFRLHGKPLLVSEVFQPAMLQALQPCQQIKDQNQE